MEEREQLEKLIKTLKQLKQARQELANVKRYGDADGQKALTQLLKLQAENARISKESEDFKNNFDYDKANLQVQLGANDPYADRVQYAKKQLEEYKKLLDKTAGEQMAAAKKVQSKKKAWIQFQNKVSTGEIKGAAAIQGQTVLLKDAIASNKEWHKANQKIVSMSKTYALMKQKLDEMIDAEDKFYDDKITAYDREIKLLQLTIEGKDALIKRQKLLNELEDKGYKMTKAEQDEILQKQKKISELKLRQKQQEEGHSLIAQSMRLMGQERQAMEYEEIRKAQQQKVGRLSQDELTRIRTLVGLKYQLSKIGSVNLMSTGTITNELAARGGFNSSVHTDSRQSINQQIANQTQGIYNTLQTIPQILRNIGVIQ